MAEAAAIGVDIGGTKVAFVLMNAAGEVLASSDIPTDAPAGESVVLDRIAEGINQLLQQTNVDVQGIGMGSPGHVNAQQGTVRNAVNLGWQEVHLSAEIQKRLPRPLPIYIQKDADAVALGEKYYGAARDCSDFVYLAIGTGLGGSAVIANKLLIGANSYSMEVGHIGLDTNGRQCRCGLRGCPEMYVSGIGLLAAYEAHGTHFPDSSLYSQSEVSTKHILAAASEHDPLALAILNEATEWIVKVMSFSAALFNPTMFVIGGGLGHAARQFFIDEAADRLQHRLLPASLHNLRVVESQIQNSAIGAASLVWYAQGIDASWLKLKEGR